MMEEKRGRNGTLIGDCLREPLVACALSYCSPKMDVWRKQEGRQQQHCLKGHSLRYNYLGESWEPGTLRASFSVDPKATTSSGRNEKRKRQPISRPAYGWASANQMCRKRKGRRQWSAMETRGKVSLFKTVRPSCTFLGVSLKKREKTRIKFRSAEFSGLFLTSSRCKPTTCWARW